MALRKILKNRAAQSSVEFLILFAIIASLTLLGISAFFPRVRRALGQDNSGNTVPGSFIDRAMHVLQ